MHEFLSFKEVLAQSKTCEKTLSCSVNHQLPPPLPAQIHYQEINEGEKLNALLATNFSTQLFHFPPITPTLFIA